MCNWGCRVFIHSNLMATSSPVEIFVPTKKKNSCEKLKQIQSVNIVQMYT